MVIQTAAEYGGVFLLGGLAIQKSYHDILSRIIPRVAAGSGDAAVEKQFAGWTVKGQIARRLGSKVAGFFAFRIKLYFDAWNSFGALAK